MSEGSDEHIFFQFRDRYFSQFDENYRDRLVVNSPTVVGETEFEGQILSCLKAVSCIRTCSIASRSENWSKNRLPKTQETQKVKKAFVIGLLERCVEEGTLCVPYNSLYHAPEDKASMVCFYAVPEKPANRVIVIVGEGEVWTSTLEGLAVKVGQLLTRPPVSLTWEVRKLSNREKEKIKAPLWWLQTIFLYATDWNRDLLSMLENPSRLEVRSLEPVDNPKLAVRRILERRSELEKTYPLEEISELWLKWAATVHGSALSDFGKNLLQDETD